MDKFNLNVYVEQVNHEAESTTQEKWDENDEQALSNVIDPNIEFKSKESERNILVNPCNSYGLKNKDASACDEKKLTAEEQILKNRTSNSDFIQLQSECLEKELENSLEGYKNRKKRSSSDCSDVAKVHVYTSSSSQEKQSMKQMDPEAQIGDTHSKLVQYPPDRITVITEKCSYLTRSPSDTNTVESHQKHKNTPRKEVMRHDSPLSSASSHESISTASVASGHIHHRSSLSNVASESSCRLDRSMTTADQLAWEFRRARDRLDTASNISGCSSRFELDSNYSERAETMSTISDVSGYEEEMFRIKRLLLLDSTTPTPSPGKYSKVKDQSIMPLPAVTTAKENVEVQIHRLTTQLQNALAEKEKYRIEAMTSENKIILEWQEKYQEVMRQKANIEGRLEIVEREISSLQSEKKELIERNRCMEHELKLKSAEGGKTVLEEMERLALEVNKLRQTIREFENKNEDLSIQLELKASDVKQWKQESQTTEDANEKLRIELQELKVECESKDGAIQGLKNKISDQHIEFQSLLQAKLKAENTLSSLKNEIESVKKSSYWYRDQLHVCQSAKVKVQQELMSSQSNSLSQSHEIEKLKVEIANMQRVVEETQHRAVREKETLMRKLEVIQADMLEREAAIMGQIHNESTADTINSITSKLKKIEEEKARMLSMSDSVVQELKEEIASLKKEINLKETALENVTSDNSDLLKKATTLQRMLSEKEMALQLLENKCKNFEMSCNHMVENLKTKDQLLLEMKNEKVAIEVALAAAGREKNDVDSAIDKLREDFARITSNYQAMKSELREKDKHVTNLKTDMAGLEKEKQNLIDKIRESKKIEEEFRTLQWRISQTEVLEKKVEELSKTNKDLNLSNEGLNRSGNYMRQEMQKLKETLRANEDRFMNLTKNYEMLTEEIKLKEKNLIDSQNENVHLKENIETFEKKVKELQNLVKKSEQEIELHKKQISQATGAIEQFNTLYRRSEEEKNKLEIKLKVVPISHVETLRMPSDNISHPPKTMSTFENGHLKAGIYKLHDAIQKNNLRLSSFLSEIRANKDSEIKNERLDKTYSSNELESILSEFVDIYDNLKNGSIWNQIISEIKMEKESSSQTESVRLDSIETQTVNVRLDSIETQTVNDDAVKYKEQVEFYLKEIARLKGSLKISEIEHREKHRKYETNIRTLLKKVKEHMRGRKMAEKTLEELRSKTEGNPDLIQLRAEIDELQSQLEASMSKYEEQRKLAEKNQEAMLELEKERGKLVQSCSISQNKLPSIEPTSDEIDASVTREFDNKTRELQLFEVQAKASELDDQVHKLHIINKDLRKEIFTERCETSQLRKQVASLQMGLDTANDMLDTKKAELGRAESLCCVLRTSIAHLKKQLEDEQQAHEECKTEVERLQASLEETKAKDPVLADQIKTLSYHLHQKTQEAAGLQEKLRLSEDRWSMTNSGLQRNLSALQEESSALRSELDSVRAGRFALQTQAAELKAALQSSIEQNKVLRLKLETFSCENKDRLPDLTLSLPLPPTKYDESRIAELLHQSTVLPHNKPLNNLQCCLDSLKEEMELLQKQIAAKTSPKENTNGDNRTEHSNVQNI
ncbi:hypothetical protein L9F63_012065 [Diploptera punctata]|uniref:Uncharacterized protein n=1 Tax=Diploptera punctata TaxID=6984 RepID=A0AAD8ADX2_DIPPU|nr:hypothetical protein L9F63_012065 [Diploptera punctata]